VKYKEYLRKERERNKKLREEGKLKKIVNYLTESKDMSEKHGGKDRKCTGW